MRTFTVVIHEDEGGGYWGEVPSLPGCYSQGASVDELLKNLREAIEGVLDVMKEDGRRRIRGSHHIYSKAGERKIIVVPVHGSQAVSPGVATRIARDANLAC